MRPSTSAIICWVLSAAHCDAFSSPFRSSSHSSFPSSALKQTSSYIRPSSLIPLRSVVEEKVEEKAEEKEAAVEGEEKPFDEREVDPTLKVLPNSWAWPPNWPYTDEQFERLNNDADGDFYKVARMEEIFDQEAGELLVGHHARYHKDGDRVLEIGASFKSYLPTNISYASVVGLGMQMEEMNKNEMLTERVAQDLNQDVTLPFEDDSFDHIVIANTIEFMVKPKELYREMQRVLRPGGLLNVAFTHGSFLKAYEPKKINLWKQMNDAQHMWILASFMKFSSARGWRNMKGYQLSAGDRGTIGGLFSKSPCYVCQGESAAVASLEDDPYDWMITQLDTASQMVEDEKSLCVLRLTAMFERAKSQEEKDVILQTLENLPLTYNVLSEMSGSVIFPPFKAKAAVVLAKKYTGSEGMEDQLRQSLGLNPPSPEFWLPLGANLTANMDVEEKMMLIAELVPLFEGSEDERSSLQEVIPTLKEAQEVLREQHPDWEAADTELLSTDLLLTDFVGMDSTNRAAFLPWLKNLTPLQTQEFLDERKNYKETFLQQ
eukprot:CAMPEP_0113938004 /NCGR_PEP_ID=MMETSP1339-20121228/4449_1 /TAXON_ID=94617 /ORGANISM="Fibrocapsa japonica" /LENGTH=546 /DNA_ID=CAMNT_0000940931 /DNA_START=71 /DNA_END=1711 /DNA_ORIENTATION=+ /assembly_acc=CAM_ASM_000762